MAERNYYVISDDGCKFPSMTKEQIYALLDETLASGHLPTDYQTAGFVNKIKEQNRGCELQFWVGTEADYNALETKPENTFCIISDDTTKDFLLQAVEGLEKRTQSMLETLTLVSQTVGKMGKVLWSGSLAMGATDAISSSRFKEQPNGIMLVFSPYINGAPRNAGYTTVCIPSALMPNEYNNEIAFPCFMTYGNLDHIGIKTMRISKIQVEGFDDVLQIAGISDNTGTRTSTSGIKYDNDYFVLRYVIGY